MTVCVLMFSSCTDYGSQIKELQEEIDQLSANLATMNDVAANLGTLRNMLAIAEAGYVIESAAAVDGGFSFVFKGNDAVVVKTKTAGISVGYENGAYYWTLNGEALKDAKGAKASVSESPKFRVADNKIQVSTDGQKTWADLLPDATGAITSVAENAAYVAVTFLGGQAVDFAKEIPVSLMLSGDSSTLEGQSLVKVEYYISGGSGEYSIATSQASGWSPMIKAETGNKGLITFVASGKPTSDEARVFVIDGAGHMTAADINLKSMSPDEDFPLMRPLYNVINIGPDGGAVDVTLRTNLDYEYELESSASTWLSYVGTKAVRTETYSFMASANESTQMRSAKVTFTSGAYSTTAVIYQDGCPHTVGQNLSENGTTNCYIVPQAGDYYFDATVIGNGQAGIIKGAGFHTEEARINPVEVEILVEFTDDPVIEDVRLQDGKIHFHATGTKGNATVCAYDEDGLVLWSWHIWCTDMPAERMHTNDDGQQFVLMDRNLGATSSNHGDGEATFGLYYQWGRKDPFAGTDMQNWMTVNSQGSLLFGVQRPFRALKTDAANSYNWIGTFNDSLWGNPGQFTVCPFDKLVKTIYDPCPAGYIVPPAYALVFFRDRSLFEYVDEGVFIKGDYGQKSFFPYAGRVYQGAYEALWHHPDEIYIALWNSGVGIYNTGQYDGGSCTTYRLKTNLVYPNAGDLRARGIPVRCVKQSAAL